MHGAKYVEVARLDCALCDSSWRVVNGNTVLHPPFPTSLTDSWSAIPGKY
jgi:hypothetical protein